MKIFLIGPTGSGKTSCAILLQKYFDFFHLQISKKLSLLYPQQNSESRLNYKKRLTQKSFSLLKYKPNFFINYARGLIRENKCQDIVIEGVRNPRDFIILFDPKLDVVVKFPGKNKTTFEATGIKAIESYCDFLSSYYSKKIIFKWEKDKKKSPEENFIFNIIKNEQINQTNKRFCTNKISL